MALLPIPCPQCAFPRLQTGQGTHSYQYAGEFVQVTGIEFCTCVRCGHQLILDEQMVRNRERITNANLEALASKWAETRPIRSLDADVDPPDEPSHEDREP